VSRLFKPAHPSQDRDVSAAYRSATALNPGDFMPRIVSRPDQDNQRRERAFTMRAFKRLAQTDDVARVVAFLASDVAQWITGDVVRVDGGSKL